MWDVVRRSFHPGVSQVFGSSGVGCELGQAEVGIGDTSAWVSQGPHLVHCHLPSLPHLSVCCGWCSVALPCHSCCSLSFGCPCRILLFVVCCLLFVVHSSCFLSLSLHIVHCCLLLLFAVPVVSCHSLSHPRPIPLSVVKRT